MSTLSLNDRERIIAQIKQNVCGTTDCLDFELAEVGGALVLQTKTKDGKISAYPARDTIAGFKLAKEQLKLDFALRLCYGESIVISVPIEEATKMADDTWQKMYDDAAQATAELAASGSHEPGSGLSLAERVHQPGDDSY